MPFDIKPCPIEGLYEIQPRVFGDSRGFFLETYTEKDYAAAGISAHFVQDNMSRSTKAVLRGLHFQKTHPQGKLVQCLEGQVFDVAVDMRKTSATLGKWYAVTLDGEKHNQFYIPEGFAHGFLVLSETALFSYKCTDYYHPEDEGGIIWDDKSIGIEWPQVEELLSNNRHYLLSDKDKNLPVYRGGLF
jgi:dTDP-4-dehydrorhamnose 3,5-epimerase